MKLSTIFLLAACLNASAAAYSQQITLKLENKPISEVFEALEKQSGYDFVFTDEMIIGVGKVNVSLSGVSLKEALDITFRKLPLSYSIINKTVVIWGKDRMSIPALPPDPIKITGRITDEEGLPLEGVTVGVKGTTVGVTTNSRGEFVIDAPDNVHKVLIITYVGRKRQEIELGSQLSLNVVMKNDAINASEVVVVAYGTQKKESLTSAITTVNTSLLENRSIPKLSTGLQGLTPGVNIRQQTGRPGYAASTFDIRGASMGTFSSNPPLVLIDGIVDDINNINPDDVASISILKDAAAAAMYGARATGGVVLITTKKGIAGIPVVSYSGVVGMQERPFGKYKFLNTSEWMRANNEASRLDGGAAIFADADIAKYENSTDPQFPVVSQWADWIKKSALQHNHNVNIKGGTEKLNFYASAGYVKQDGFVANDDYTRKNLLLNLNYVATEKFEINTSISYIKEDVTRPASGIGSVSEIMRNSLMTVPTTPFRLPNGDYNNATMWGNNPAYVIGNAGNGLYDFNSLRMGVTAKYKILSNLSLKYVAATNMAFNSDNIITKKIPFRNNNGEITGYNTSAVSVSENWAKSVYLSNQLMLEYNNKWQHHTLNLVGGAISEDQRVDNISAGASQFPNNEIRELVGTTGTGNQISGSSSATDWAIASLVGRINYAYKNKYLFESSVRYDGSSRFSPDKRWGLFPSVSLGWRIIEENFMKDVSFISDLKLRASWGQLGNQGASLYPFAQNVSTSGRQAFGSGLVAVAALGSPVNLGLTWEKKRTINAGIDYGFFRNRLTGSFDYFSDRTNGIIGSPSVPTTFGANAPVQNTYIIENRGFEFEVKWSDRIGKVSYFAGFNLSDTRDKVVSLGGIGTTDPRFGNGLVQLSSSSYLHEGEARNHFYLYKTNGLFVSQDEINKHAFISTLTRPGDIAFIDTDGNNSINSSDMVPDKRSSTPHYIFGINLGLEYKGFDFMTVINGVWQRWEFRNNGGVYLTGVRPTLALLQGNYDRRWTEANPNKWADQPRLTQNNWIANDYSTMFGAPNEYHLRNYGYLRVKNIQLGYTLPAGVVKSIKLTKIRVYVTFENMFTFTPGYTENVDPESIMNWTNEGSSYFGQPRVMSAGLSVIF